MSIPLINEVNKNDINTSIIAIKKNIERINTLLGLNNTEEIDISIFATKEELEQAETDLAPVDEVTSGNMQSVTSNAVAKTYGEIQTGEVTMTLASGQYNGVDVLFPKEFSKIPHVFATINDTMFPNEVLATNVSAIDKSHCFIRGYNYYPSALTFKVVWFAIAM